MLVENPPVFLDTNTFANDYEYYATMAKRYMLGQYGFPLRLQHVLQYFSAPAAASNTAFVNAKALPAQQEEWTPGVTTGVTAYSIDYAQTLRLVCSGAQTGDVVIHGTDVLGKPIQETIALNGTTAVYTLKAFQTVTKFVVPAKAGSENITIGTHHQANVGRYGLLARLPEPMVILCDTVTGVTALPSAGYWVKADLTATSSTGGDQRGLWRPSTAPDGSKSFAILYVAG